MDTKIVKPKDKSTSDKAKFFVKRHEQSKSWRHNWDEFWQDITNFVIPEKNDVYEKYNNEKGDRKHNRLYEASAIHFNEMLANTLHSMMTNPSQIWFELNHRDKKINNLPRVRKYLQDLAEMMTNILNNTNFQAQVHEVYLDLGSLGTGVLNIMEDDETVMRFDSKPIYYFYIHESDKGIVDEISYVEKYTCDKAFEKFGEEAFGDKADKLKQKGTDNIEILHYIMPRPRAERYGFGQTEMPFQSVFIWLDEEIILKEEGFNEFPFVVPRWLKITDEKYGRSPSMKALPDIKMLNQMMKTTIRGAQKSVDPPLLVPDDGLLGRVNARPGGLIPYRAGTDDRVSALNTGSDPKLGIEIIEYVRNRVKEHYYVDQFQLREGPQMTATEVNARVDMQLRLLGPILGRLHNEFLQPMVARMLNIMIRKGQMPEEVPPELQDDFELEVFFTSQIAKAQRSGEATNMLDFLAAMQPVVQFEPAAADTIDIDAVIRKIAILKGVSEDIFRTEEEIGQLREDRNAKQQQAEQTQQELAGAEVLNKAVPAMNQMGG